jgi:Uma2 family endonuclease
MSAAPQLDPSRLATYEDLLAYPEKERVEILDGVVVVAQASALPIHNEVLSCILERLRAPFRHGRGGPGGWWIIHDIDVRLATHDVVRPDVVGWRQERLPAPGNTRPIDVLPDWACEVLSPSTRSVDRGAKMALYARAGLPYYWLVEPFGAIEVFALEQGRWVRVGWYERGAVARIPPFEAIELPVAELFPPEPAAVEVE